MTLPTTRWRRVLAENRVDRTLGERHALEDVAAGRFHYTPDELFSTEPDYEAGYLGTWLERTPVDGVQFDYSALPDEGD